MAKGGKGKAPFLERHQDTINFIIAITLLLLVVVIFSIIKVYFQVQDYNVVAKVNGAPIYEVEIDARMDNLPLQQQKSTSKEVVLDQIIQEELLDQRIKALGLEATEQEIIEAKKQFMQKNSLDDEGLERVLQAQGTSEESLNNALENQVLLNKLLEIEVFGDLEVTRQEARDYYEENAEQFIIPEFATIQQALVTTQNRTERNARLTAEKIMAETQDDVCEEADKYLERLESSCGNYNISRFSGLPEEFVNLSFDLEIGDTEVLETWMGFHVIKKINQHNERVIAFENVLQQVQNVLLNAKKKEAYRKYLTELRENSEIENYLLDEIAVNITESRGPGIEEVATCVSQNTALYGARWDSQTKQQLGMVRDHDIEYVECSLPDTVDEQRDICEEAGIRAYPTWVINGEQRMEVLTFEQVAKLAGCD